eukprot:g5803.t1
MSLPVLKLGTLMAKTISKPVGKALQRQATQSQGMLRHACVALGNGLHTLKFRVNDLLNSEFHVKKIRPLDTEVALSNGANFFGESFVFAVAAGVVVFEANDKLTKERKKKRKAAEEEAERRAELVRGWGAVEERVETLQKQHRALQARCDEQLRAIARDAVAAEAAEG